MSDNTDLSTDACQLNRCMFFTLSKLSRGMKKMGDGIFAKTGLSPSHAFVLYIVALKEKVHQKEVGEYLHLTPSTMTRFVEKLDNKKLLSKEVEGKNVFLSITKEGKALQPVVMDAWAELTEHMNNALTKEERETFLRLSQKMLDYITD